MSGEARDANAAQRRYWNTVAGPRWVASPEFRERRNQESMALLLEFLFSADEPHGLATTPSTPAGRQNRGLLFLDAGHTATGRGGLPTGGGGIGLGGSSMGGR